MVEKCVIVDKKDRFLYFANPIYEIAAQEFSEVKKALEEIDTFRKSKFFLAGFISYEASYGFIKFQHQVAKKKHGELPLLWFGVFPKYEVIEIPKTQKDYQIAHIRPELEEKKYLQKVGKVREFLRRGDTYQVNLTFKIFFEFQGDPFSLYLDLRKKQTVEYGFFVKLKEKSILSLSPELFFELRDKRIKTRPMKGTISRGKYLEEDWEMMGKLMNSEKNQAENLMIVDLLRNDLGKISQFGSVRVEKLFEVEKYETVFQLTSAISSVVEEEKISEILMTLFPCGSVTGAPKVRTMEIINLLESTPRGVYTGAMGMITPNYALFNVAIRTPFICQNKGEMGLGGGITWYSDPREEYQEALLKSKFVQIFPAEEFKLIETMLLKDGELYLLNLHLERLKKSAEYFLFKFDKEYITSILQNAVHGIKGENKVRLLLSKNGKLEVEIEGLERKPRLGYIKVAPERTNSEDVFLFHKTTKRDLYNKYYQKAQAEGLIDYIFLNEKGEITEGCVHNIILRKDHRLITPRRESGLLKGVMLEYLSQKLPISEKRLTTSDLEEAQAIYLCNSVTGIKKVLLL